MENNKINSNPWLGLKTYDEGQHLYGREDDIHALSQNILFNIQTVIYGKSGIGKSSILNAGIFPILRKSNFFPCYIRLVHNQPNKSYNQQIWDSVLNSLLHLKKEKLTADGTKEILSDIEGRYEELAPARDNESLWEIFHRHKFYDESNNVIQPVLVFDQFEEIFTREKDQEKVTSFFEELADLINNVVPETLCTISDVNIIKSAAVDLDDDVDDLLDEGYEAAFADYLTESNFHIVLSLREDYLSYLERNIDNIPSLKHNRYCLKPLSEEQAASVIMHPCPRLISETVAKEIISKVTGSPVSEFELGDGAELEVDSAILSLFLHELYKKKPVDAKVIDYSIVNEFGDNIIQNFYEETISHISEDCAEYLERKLITEDGKRDSVYESHVINHKGYKASDLKYLKEQRLIREFPWNDGIRIEFIHDVLCPIIVQRKEERKIARKRLEQERIQQEELIKLKQDKIRYRNLCLLIFVSILFVGIFIWDGLFRVHTKRYADIVKEKTWMKGLRPLSKDDANHMRFHYVFYRTGRYANHADSIEARNGYGKLTSDHGMGTYLVNQFDDSDNKADKQIVDQLKRVVKWVLIPDYSNEFCLQEKAYDEEGSLIYAYNNTVLDDHVVMSTYVNEFGLPIIMRDSCYIFLKTTLDEYGHEILQEFYDDQGYPIKNRFDSYKLARTYLHNGLQTSEASLFVNGLPMIDRVGNCGWKALDFTKDNCNVTLSAYFDSQGNVCYDNDSIMIKKWQYDDYGRCVKETYWKIEEEYDIEELEIGLSYDLITLHPNCNKEGIHGYIYEYNDYGQTILVRTIDSLGNKVIPSNQDYAEIYRQYDSNGNMVSEIAVDKGGNHTYEFFANYLDNGDLIYQKSLTIDEYQDTTLYYHLFWDVAKKCLIEKDYYPNSDYYVYKELDSNRRTVVKAFYTISTNAPDSTLSGRHKTVYSYQYDKESKSLIVVEQYFDVRDNMCIYGNGSNPLYHKEICKIDSIANTQSIRRFTTENLLQYGVEFSENPPEKFYQGYEFLYTDNTFEVQVGEASIDENGHRCRTYNNNAYYYQVKYITSILPSHNSYRKGLWVINEFGEQSLVRVNGELYSARLFNTNQYFDEYNQEIKSGEEIDRPMFVAIENGYDIGFCDGDILVQQDDWVLWTNSSFDVSLSGLNLEPQSATEHTFKVLRFDEQNNDYELVEIIIPQNDERICQVTYMKYYVTKKEYRRINRILRNKLYPHMFEFVPKEDGALWNAGMTSPGLIISINEWDMTNHFKGEKDSLYNLIKEFNGVDKHITVYNEETEKINTYTVSCDTLGCALESYTLRPTYFSEIYNKWVEYTE